MKDHILDSGQKIIYIKGDFHYNQFVIVGYYIGEFDDASGKIYLTTNPERVQSFDKNKILMPNDKEIFIASGIKRIHNYSDKLLKRYENLYCYLIGKVDVYHKATKFCLLHENFQDLDNAFEDNTRLFPEMKEKQFMVYSKMIEKNINNPLFYVGRFTVHISWKYIHGWLKRLAILLLFFKDLIAHLYEDYFSYRAAIFELDSFKKSKEELPKNDVQERYNNEHIDRLKKKIENKKDIYAKSNRAFFTLFFAAIILLATVITNNNSVNIKDNEISNLKARNEQLLQELNDLKYQNEKEIHINQNQINNNLLFSLNKLTEIVNELKKHLTE